MGLYFSNESGTAVQLVYGYHTPGCEGGVDWSKKGWYKVPHGRTIMVLSGRVGGNTYFFYAEGQAGGGPVWAGQYFTQIPSFAFDWCWNTGSTSARNLGLRVISVPATSVDHTIRLTR